MHTHTLIILFIHLPFRDHHKDIPHTRPTVLTVSQLPKIEEAINECVDIDTTNDKS